MKSRNPPVPFALTTTATTQLLREACSDNTMWSTEKTLELIELFHSSPALWDVTCVDYKKKMKKIDALTEMADKLSVSVSEIEKKIKAIKVQFRREYLKLASLKRSGISPNKCSWFGYKPLMFLLQGQESRASRSTDSTEREVSC